MAYDLIDLNYSSAPKDRCYFFDSNILLPILGLPAKPEMEVYLKYFKAVYENCLIKPELKIYTSTNQLSEVFNILMNVEFKKMYDDNQKKIHTDPKKFYKNIFRPSDQYLRPFKIYKEELLNFNDVFELIDLGAEEPLNMLLEFNVKKLDLNDLFFLKCVQKTKAILVSNDNDFYGEDITHATFLRTTIKTFKDSVKVIAKK